MELSFNELSAEPLSDNKFEANNRMILFAKTIAQARKTGFRKIRSHYSTSEIKLSTDYSFHNWMFDNSFSPEYRAIFYDMFVHPFIKEDNEDAEKKYVEANYYYEDEENGLSKKECVGLAAAFLNETPAISFDSSMTWRKNVLNIVVEKYDTSDLEEIYNVFSKGCFCQDIITKYVEDSLDFELLEIDISPNNKELHLTTHHGQKELKEFWERIKNSPYVVKAISIEWGGNSFFKNPQRNGKVDIVHLKSDRRYVLQVQTTGRSLRETIAIAEILKQKYS